jgi:hypothetical protein
VSSIPFPDSPAVAPVRRRLVAAAALALLPAAGCTTWSHERYLARIGLLAGQQAVLENYQRALERRDFAAIGALFDDSNEGSERARATDDLEEAVGRGRPSSTIDMVEADVRDFDLFAERPTATLGFNVGARTSDGVRHVVRLRARRRSAASRATRNTTTPTGSRSATSCWSTRRRSRRRRARRRGRTSRTRRSGPDSPTAIATR